MKKYYLRTSVFTRVNEDWIDDTIDCTPLNYRHCNSLIQGTPNTTRFQPKFYDLFALDIVTETVYNYPYPYITEKTFRPISCKKLFIIIGAPGTLKLLEEYGFDVFPDIICSEYDNIVDPNIRWKKLEETIRNFASMQLEAVKSILQDLEPRLEKNFQLLKNLEQIEIQKFNDSN